MLGATDELLMYCRNYLMILVIFTPACMLQSLFQSYLVTAERPTLGLILIILAGVLNAVLDYVLIVHCHLEFVVPLLQPESGSRYRRLRG